MKTALSAAAAVVMLATLVSSQGGTGQGTGAGLSSGRAADEAAIRKLGDHHASAWNKADARGAASVFAEDGSFVMADGRTLKGRSAIEQGLANDTIGTTKTGQTMSIETDNIRFLEPNLAIASGRTRLSGAGLPAGAGGHYMAVVRKEGSAWKVMAVHAAANPPGNTTPAVETASMTGTSGSSASDEGAVDALEREWLEALRTNDVAKLDQILAEDFVEVGPMGESRGKQASIAETRSGDMAFESFDVTDTKTRVYGNSALVIGTANVKAKYKGEDISGTYRWTDAFVKRNGRWQAVSGHVTRVITEK